MSEAFIRVPESVPKPVSVIITQKRPEIQEIHYINIHARRFACEYEDYQSFGGRKIIWRQKNNFHRKRVSGRSLVRRIKNENIFTEVCRQIFRHMV